MARKENKNAFIVVVSFHLFFFFFVVVVVGNSAQHSVSEPVPAHRCRARRPRPKTRSKRPFSLSPRPAPPPSGPTGAFPFPPPFSPPAPAPTAPRIPAHVREDRPPRFPPRARIAPPSPEPSQQEETVPRSGAAYRGATPRGARGSTTRCRGRQRRGTPGSRPSAPQSCRAKRTPLVSTARPRHASVPPPAAPSAGPLPALKESSHPVTIIRFQSERVCRGRAQHSAAPAACSALLRAPVACTSGEGNTKLFPSEILQTSSTKTYCNSRKSVHAIMNSVFLLNPSAVPKPNHCNYGTSVLLGRSVRSFTASQKDHLPERQMSCLQEQSLAPGLFHVRKAKSHPSAQSWGPRGLGVPCGAGQALPAGHSTAPTQTAQPAEPVPSQIWGT